MQMYPPLFCPLSWPSKQTFNGVAKTAKQLNWNGLYTFDG